MKTGEGKENRALKKRAGNAFIMFGILLITTLEWHVFEWYQSYTRYGTLITFFALAGAFLCYVDIRDAFNDKLFWVMVVTDLIALINLFIIGSDKGCILIVVDFMLILYLADKIEFNRIEKYSILVYVAFFFFYWTVDVKGYFKGYNTNYGGLILITGFCCLMIIMQVFNERKRLEYEEMLCTSDKKNAALKWLKKNFLYIAVYLFFIALSFNIISWYRSRTALVGLLVLLVLILLPGKIVLNRFFYNVLCALSTVGAILFSLAYIGIAGIFSGNTQLFYKDLVSGRNEIWTELFSAFLKSPIMGIGSSYEMKLSYMNGMFEAHSAMIDILTVHGLVVFVLLCAFFIYRLVSMRERFIKSSVGKVTFAAIICILVTGFFENFYIVQPFSLILFALLGAENG